MADTDTTDTAGTDLRALGAQMDATGVDSSSATSEPEQRAPGAEESTTEGTSAAKPAGESSDNPEKKPADQAQNEQQKPADKEPSKYEKAKQREAEAWKKINDEKAALAREREEVARLRTQTPRQPAKAAEPAKDGRGFTADDYDAAAKEFEKDGDTDMAAKAKAEAAKLREKDAAGQQTEAQQRFQTDWRTDMEKAIQGSPDLGKPDSADAKELSQLLTDEPIFGHIPNGFSKAVAVLQLRREAGQVKGLKETISKHEAEIARLTKLTSISGGGPSGPPAGQKTFDQMSDGEQRAYLEREAARADSYLG